MKAGELRHYVTFRSRAGSDDGMGGETSVWSDAFSAWAAIWPLRANEIVENMRVGVDITHRLRIRYRSGVTHQMRVVFGSRTFEVKAIINPDERNIMLDLICLEIDAT